MIRNDEISSFLQERIAEGDFPSAVYLVWSSGSTVFADALGSSVKDPVEVSAEIDTIYDAASLTKVLITTLLIAKLLQEGKIAAEDPISKYFPEYFDPTDNRRTNLGDATILELLTHTSGWPAWLPLYLLDRDEKPQMPDALFRSVPDGLSGSKKSVVYSDLNFIALGALIERIQGDSLDHVAQRVILEPLDLVSTFYNPPAGLRSRIAASENGNSYECQTCVDMGFLKSSSECRDHLRTYPIWGEVHDGNAWHLGGVAGHAGLFSTAGEMLRIAEQFMAGHGMLLNAQTCQLFRQNFTAGMEEDRSYGFQLASTPLSTAGELMSPDAFGHLGFTGTSLWIDPLRERVFVLLTNRTHARELPFANINAVRRRFHDLANAALDKFGSN